MFNSFMSKVKDILSTNSNLKPTKSKKVQPTVTVSDKATPVAPLTQDTNNRVVFTPKASSEPKEVVREVVKEVVVQKSSKADLEAIKVETQKSQAAQKEAQRLLDEARQLQTQSQSKENEILKRLSSLDERERYLLQKEKNLDTQTDDVKKKLAQIDDLYRKQLDKLEQISGLDVEKAKQLIISSTEKKMATWISKKIDEAKEEVRRDEDEQAKEILVQAIRHGITDYVAEYTVSTITLPDEKVKGKIIGREGRNIRAFEKATGVELELDETNDIRISSFDSTRREIAKVSLGKLIKDGRIQPVKIEQVVQQTIGEMDKILVAEGRRICQEVGVFNLPIDLIKEIGKYKYRFSYGQNLAKHTIEATKIAVAVAYDLKADVNTVRLGALLHDIGKVITDQEGTHIELGVNLLRKFKLPEAVINAVAEHHEDKEFSSAESVIVYIGDAASGARPGARYEVHEEYLKRMQNIEDAAKGFPGVLSVAAYQAGREVMVIVEPNTVSDAEATVLSQNIADKLEEEAKWAGQIKVTVVRETRTSATITGSKINKSAVKNAS